MVKNMSEGLCKNLPHLLKRNRIFFYKVGLITVLLYTDQNQVYVLVYIENLLACFAYQSIGKSPHLSMKWKSSPLFLLLV